MLAVRFRFQFGLMLATAFSVSMLPTAGRAYTPEQQQACSGDAMRLCGPDIPDVDRITACMIRRKAELSPECRVYFMSPAPPPPEPPVARTNVGKPLSIKPATAQKPASAKQRKPKKPAKPVDE
jgi:hypothetical protein